MATAIFPGTGPATPAAFRALVANLAFDRIEISAGTYTGWHIGGSSPETTWVPYRGASPLVITTTPGAAVIFDGTGTSGDGWLYPGDWRTTGTPAQVGWIRIDGTLNGGTIELRNYVLAQQGLINPIRATHFTVDHIRVRNCTSTQGANNTTTWCIYCHMNGSGSASDNLQFDGWDVVGPVDRSLSGVQVWQNPGVVGLNARGWIAVNLNRGVLAWANSSSVLMSRWDGRNVTKPISTDGIASGIAQDNTFLNSGAPTILAPFVDGGNNAWSAANAGRAASVWPWSTAASGGGALDHLGASAVTFRFSTAAAGGVSVRGIAASAFGWSDAATGIANLSPMIGTAASVFRWSDAATGTARAGVTGVAASLWRWSTAGKSGKRPPKGGHVTSGRGAARFTWSTSGIAASQTTVIGASAFGWSTSAAGGISHRGTAASAWGWETNAAGGALSGTVDGSFGWSTAGSGGALSGTAASAWSFATAGAALLKIDSLGIADSGFGWSTAASGMSEAIGQGASVFGWSASGTALLAPVVTGVATGAFGWETAATGTVSVIGVAASTFGWGDGSAAGSGTVTLGGGGQVGDDDDRLEPYYFPWRFRWWIGRFR